MNKLTSLLLFFLLLLGACKNRLEDIYKKFGTDLNKDRLQFHLVVVDPNSFQIVEDPSDKRRRYIFVDHTENKLSYPAFLRKIIMLDSTRQKLSFEEDYFKNPAQRKYIVIRHDYTFNSTDVYLQSFMDLYSTTESKWIDNKQADSVLKSWNVSRNPF